MDTEVTQGRIIQHPVGVYGIAHELFEAHALLIAVLLNHEAGNGRQRSHILRAGQAGALQRLAMVGHVLEVIKVRLVDVRLVLRVNLFDTGFHGASE